MKNDSFNLVPSSSLTVNGTDQTADLSLSAASSILNSSVSGKVYKLDGSNKVAIADATVVVYNDSGTSVGRAITNTDGDYSISDIPLGTYTVTATKTGFISKSSTGLSITSILPSNIDFELTEDSKSLLNQIYGTVISKDNLKINGAEILLYTVSGDTKTLVASTTSIDDGSYLLSGIATGTYQVVARKKGYATSENALITLTTSQNSLQNFTLTVLPDRQSNLVKGIIKDDKGSILIDACVGLYKIESDIETLMAVTYTNSNGEYVFSDVENGTYIVKAKAYANG